PEDRVLHGSGHWRSTGNPARTLVRSSYARQSVVRSIPSRSGSISEGFIRAASLGKAFDDGRVSSREAPNGLARATMVGAIAVPALYEPRPESAQPRMAQSIRRDDEAAASDQHVSETVFATRLSGNRLARVGRRGRCGVRSRRLQSKQQDKKRLDLR